MTDKGASGRGVLGKGAPPPVSLSPLAMVDNVSDWPLHRVVEHLRKKEKESPSPVQLCRISCRSTIKLLPTVIDELASRYGVSRNHMCRWLSYHGVAIAREDAVLNRLSAVYAQVRRMSLAADDADAVDLLNSLVPYSPRIADDRRVNLQLYDSWVLSEFEDRAMVCGVYGYHLVQIFMVRSILSEDTDHIEVMASRLIEELERWRRWMGMRLGALEQLASLGQPTPLEKK